MNKIIKQGFIRIFVKQGHPLLLLPFQQLWIWALSRLKKEKHKGVIRLMELSSLSPSICSCRSYSATTYTTNPFGNNP
jgi:hypothetical protein